jgi:putative nucleotidyltransferase with HDIG domain
MITKSIIENCFNELKCIKNKDIRNKTVQVWLKTANIGKWKKIDDIPFTLLFENSGRLTDHTKGVTNLAKNILDLRDEDINQDFLISGAILHDVGKLFEYKVKNGKISKSSFGKVIRHPVSGSKLAWECGLPDEILHIIYAHSHEGNNLKRSPEAIMVNHCDFIDFEIKKSIV